MPSDWPKEVWIPLVVSVAGCFLYFLGTKAWGIIIDGYANAKRSAELTTYRSIILMRDSQIWFSYLNSSTENTASIAMTRVIIGVFASFIIFSIKGSDTYSASLTNPIFIFQEIIAAVCGVNLGIYTSVLRHRWTTRRALKDFSAYEKQLRALYGSDALAAVTPTSHEAQ